MNENLSIKIEKLEKLIKECHGSIINSLNKNNEYLKEIIDCQYDEKQGQLYSDLELAKNIINKIINDSEKTIGKSTSEDQEIILPNLREIIFKLQEITTKLDHKRHVTIEDLEKYLIKSKTSVLTIAPPARIL